MNRLTSEQRAAVITCLIEGCSVRSTVRSTVHMTGVAKKTVLHVLVEVGAVCADYQDRVTRNLKSERVQIDEMWQFVYCKQKERYARHRLQEPRRRRCVARSEERRVGKEC